MTLDYLLFPTKGLPQLPKYEMSLSVSLFSLPSALSLPLISHFFYSRKSTFLLFLKKKKTVL